ncbi:MFS transporter, partial [Acinetobacter baumannii]
MALVQVLFSPLERVSRMAMFGVIGGLAAIAGPIVGGLLIQADVFDLGWRVVFLINVPVGLGAVLAG